MMFLVSRKKSRTFLLGTMAGSLALSSPFAFHPISAEAKEHQLELQQLKYGDHHEAVVHLQKKLKLLNYYSGEVIPNYNVLTEHAVRSFQHDHNLPDHGVTDEVTMSILETEVIDYHLEVITNNAESITNGERSNKVKQIQKSLDYFGVYDGEIDGIAGPLTKKALDRIISLKDLSINLDNFYPVVEVNNVQSSHQNEAATSNEVETVVQTNELNQNSAVNHSSVIETARSYMGTPYVWGGTSPSGFDCSGFIQYIFGSHGTHLPRTVSDIWNSTVSIDQPSVGDLVFFETYKAGPSHLGIYIGDGNFIHAGLNNGVTISNLSESYWNTRYLGAKRVGN